MKILLMSRRSTVKPTAKSGEEIVVLGNGPSLNDTIAHHADFLACRRKIAVNFAANTPVFRELRPDYYVLADPHFFSASDPNVDKLWNAFNAIDWPMTLFVPATTRTNSRIRNIKAANSMVAVAYYNMTPIEGFKWFRHAVYRAGLGMPRPRNVLNPSLMLAIASGFKSIYVAGADHSWMQTLLQQSGMDQRTLREVEDNIRYFMGSVSDMNGTIRISVIMNNNIRLTAPEGNYLDYSINLEEQEWYPLFMEQGVYAESGMGRGIFTRGDQWYLNIYYPINNRYSLEQMGILVFTIERENMQEFMKSNIAGGYLALQDENGNEIQNNFPQELKDGKASHTNRFFNTQETIQIQNMELTMNVVLDEDRFEVDNTNIWFGFCIVLFGMMGVFVIIGTVFSRYITMPIIKCKEALLRIRNNEVGILLENPYKDEIGELIDGFNEMSESLHDLIEKNKIISTLQKETEYQMLIQQINPHFLYNTLEIINGLILGHKDTEAVNVCETLGKIFRYNLNQNKWVTIQEEMRYIRQYLLIMKYKIPDLSVYYDVEPQLEQYCILKSILQPLVENAMKHGFYQKSGECCLTITIQEERGRILLSVMDNGNGISREKYFQLQKELEDIKKNPNQKRDTSSHVGIRNVFQRMYLEYEDSMEFKIIAREGKGTRIQIYLPKGVKNV